ncbi:MAG: biotin transporter BioY, partial [Actinobacteria bacterium]|nr:biotin transporter BioY [Actinomycetota bacterium]
MTTLPIAPLTLRAALFPHANSLTNSLLALGGTGFLAVMAQIAIPVPGSPVPVTGQTLGVLLIGASYGPALSV